VISFATPDFGCLKYQTQLLPYVNLLELTIYGHLSCKSMALFHPRMFDLFNPDQWSNDPLLDQWSRSPPGLQTSEISNLKLSSLLTGYLLGVEDLLTCTSQINGHALLWDLDLLNQINGPKFVLCEFSQVGPLNSMICESAKR
jgi:hypothetical protein